MPTKSNQLVRIWQKNVLVTLISYWAFLGVALFKKYNLNQTAILPVLFLMLLAGLGIIQYGFKTNIEKEYKAIDEYMANVSNSQKIVMRQGSITICLIFIILTYISAMIVFGFNK